MNRHAIWVAVALSCLCGAEAGNNFSAYHDAKDRWWTPDTNTVAAHRTFETAHRLEEGGMTRFFSRALESELARPDGADSNTVALALDVLAWSGDMSVTGALNRALFDANNPYRAQTFYACVVAAQSDHADLARDVTLRVPVRERDMWYRSAVSNCPALLITRDIFGYDHVDAHPLFMRRPDRVRANLRLQNYFHEASVFETAPECAWTLYRLAFKEFIDISDADIELSKTGVYSEAKRMGIWQTTWSGKERDYVPEDEDDMTGDEEDVPEEEDDVTKKKRSLAERFAGTPGQIGENFSLEIEYEACQEYERSFFEDRKINEDFFITVQKEDSIPLVIEKFAGLMREKPPFSDGHSLEAHHLRIRETLETLEKFCHTNLSEVQEHVISTIPNEHSYRVPSNWAPKKRNTYGLYDESLSQKEAAALMKERLIGLIEEPIAPSDGDAIFERDRMISTTLLALRATGGFTDDEIVEFVRPVATGKMQRHLIRDIRLFSEMLDRMDAAAPQPEKTEAAK